MKKFDNLKLGRIVLDSEVNKKFLDFKNNQDLFCDGTENEYYAALYNYIRRLIYNSRTVNEMILNKTFVSNVIRIIKEDILVKNNLKELVYLELIHYLYVYYETIHIVRLSGNWPYTEEDKNIRKEAITLLKNQMKEVENFFQEIEYDKRLKEILENYKEKLTIEKELTNEEFNELDLIFSTSHNIPQEYIDLYFRNIMKYSKIASFDSLKNALNSFVHNYALSHGTYCYLDICTLKVGTLGSYDNHVIAISDRMINGFYLSQLVRRNKIFDTIFHELTHLLQEEIYTKENLPYEYIMMLEDFILSNILSEKYGDDNYIYLYHEVDARRSAFLKTDEYLRNLGIIPKKNALKSIEEDERKHKKSIRYYNKKEKNVDVLFDENIEETIRILKDELRIDMFKEYPVFNYMYHKDGTRKTTLELIKEKNQTSNPKIINQINEILNNRNLSKEDISRDLEELILDDDQNIEEDKSYMIERLNKLLTLKERSKLLVRLDSISLKMKEFVRGFAILCGEMNELQLEYNDLLVDRVLEHKLTKENENID